MRKIQPLNVKIVRNCQELSRLYSFGSGSRSEAKSFKKKDCFAGLEIPHFVRNDTARISRIKIPHFVRNDRALR